MPNVVRIKSNELLYTPVNNTETYYFLYDTGALHRDYRDGANYTRNRINFVFVETEKQRVNEIIPQENMKYYVWETNELWVYVSYWILLAGTKGDNKSYYHGVTATINSLDTGLADNNGLLADGSLIVRDAYRNIKGRVFADLSTNNLVISSFVGGGITFLPYGVTDTITYLPDPQFKYRVYTEDTGDHHIGEYVLDEYGYKIIDSIVQIPEYNPEAFGKVSIDINNTYNSGGSVATKTVLMKLSSIAEVIETYTNRASKIEASRNQQIAENFDEEETYNVNDECVYEEKLWKCLVQHTGEWDAEDFYLLGSAYKRNIYYLYAEDTHTTLVHTYTVVRHTDDMWYTVVDGTNGTIPYRSQNDAECISNRDAYWTRTASDMYIHGNLHTEGSSGLVSYNQGVENAGKAMVVNSSGILVPTAVSGTVTSVNGKVGVVVLDADDIDYDSNDTVKDKLDDKLETSLVKTTPTASNKVITENDMVTYAMVGSELHITGQAVQVVDEELIL